VTHVDEARNRALEQCRRTRAAFERLRHAQDQGQPANRERVEFLSNLRAFHEVNLELHNTLGRAEDSSRRAMHEAFKRSRDAYLEAEATLAKAKKARDRGEDDGPERATFLAQVRAYHQLSRAAHELAAKVEPSCEDGRLARINEALQDQDDE
jgi:hypothetical protein